MADRNVEVALDRFTWRMLSQYVSPWEFEALKKKIQTWDQWCEEWSKAARRHAEIADTAAGEGNRHTAGTAYVRAALYYHWASFLFVHDQKQWRAAMEAMGECWKKAAPLVDPPMELFEIPFGGVPLPGYLRQPAGVGNPPLAILVPGGDSTKEELYDFGEHMLKRGIAVFAFDGPGQGLVSARLKLRPDFEVPIRAVTDFILQRVDLDSRRVAIGGISYGGLFACRAAAFDDRFKAVFSISSWYTPAGRFPGMDPLSQTGLKQYMGENAQQVQDSITMKGAAGRIEVPLLQVYGGLDKASPPEHAYRVEKEVKGPATTIVFEDGVHVCNNLHHIVRPLIADWVAEQLR
ncbi:MAG: alpha/beta fold hydrolase [Betaproteobacteria bacterium]|nr:alpha/beta fold hydrolase [Betaproteobacteria bacterium]